MVNPMYPEGARAKRVRGLVKMHTLISPAGDVVDVRIIEGLSDGLNEAAVDAVRQWKFAPTVHGGVAMPVLLEMFINFRLR
jgi:protein TonB